MLSHGFRSKIRVVALFGAVIVLGCVPPGSAPQSGIVVTPPGHWRTADLGAHTVPGKPIAAWTGPEMAALVVYKTLPIPGGTPAHAAQALATRLEHLPGFELEVNRTETIAGLTVGRVEVVAPGTGDALAPSSSGVAVAPPGRSLIPTRQITVLLVQSTETIQLAWCFPESAHATLMPDVQATLESLQITAGRADWQSYN